MKIRLLESRLPKAIASLSYSNQLLKAVSAFGMLLSILLTILACYLANRPSVVIALSESGQRVDEGSLPVPEKEIRAAVLAYLQLRYQWTPEYVAQNIRAAEAFILPSAVTTYRENLENTLRFSKEKNVGQRVFPEIIDVDLDSESVTVKGDRISIVQGIRAAGPLSLKLSFESGRRTKANPWGIYFSKELELPLSSSNKASK